MERHHTGHSTTGRPGILLLYRVFMFFVTLAVLYIQVTSRSMRAFRYFTVWNWIAIIVYFFLASISSIRWMLHSKIQQGQKRGKPSLLDVVVTSMFHFIVPMTLFIDVITWSILVPTLVNHPDPERAAHWKGVMFSTISYMQHGGNAFIMFGETMLNMIPNSDMWSHGVVALWNLSFALWSFYFFWSTGENLYPFMDYTKQSAYISFISLFASGIGCSFLVQKFLRHKHATFLGSSSDVSTSVWKHD